MLEGGEQGGDVGDELGGEVAEAADIFLSHFCS